MPAVEKVRDLVEPLVRARRCSLYDLELSRHGTTAVLRVVIDRPGGVDTETCATVSRLVSRSLDESAAVPGAYTLEVSSPGLERQLRRPEHFASVAGSGMTARVKARCEGAVSVLEGVVAEAGDSAFRLETSGGGAVEVRYDDVVSARTVFEWGAGKGESTIRGARR